MIAITDLVFGNPDDEPGTDPKRVPAGTEVKQGDFPKEIWDHFVENGSVGEAPGKSASVEQEEELDRLRAEVARLKAQQANADKPPADQSSKPTGK
jgi:hypothetical protein